MRPKHVASFLGFVAVHSLGISEHASAQGLVSCSVNSGYAGNPQPGYFSGTNCRITCYATPVIGDLFHVRVTFSDTLYTETALDLPLAPNDGMGVVIPLMFDSTHFHHGLPLTVTIEA